MVLALGMRLVAIGAVAGLAFATALNAALATVLAGFPPTDPVAFAGAVLLIALVGMAACYVPVRRAAGLDPMVVLRYE
jgi:ABC-type antimicrobial peptide transport system permease subunit